MRSQVGAVFLSDSGQIVNDQHPISVRRRRAGEVRADESCVARDETSATRQRGRGFGVHAFQTWPGRVRTDAMALRVSTMHLAQAAS